ncbi:hypothetical protein OSTOST_22284 [Ostertagia ostertagi]
MRMMVPDQLRRSLQSRHFAKVARRIYQPARRIMKSTTHQNAKIAALVTVRGLYFGLLQNRYNARRAKRICLLERHSMRWTARRSARAATRQISLFRSSPRNR